MFTCSTPLVPRPWRSETWTSNDGDGDGTSNALQSLGIVSQRTPAAAHTTGRRSFYLSNAFKIIQDAQMMRPELGDRGQLSGMSGVGVAVANVVAVDS